MKYITIIPKVNEFRFANFFVKRRAGTYLVLERQNALSQTKGRELNSMTDYGKAIAELQRVMGTTLTSANVEVQSAPKK